MTFGISIQVREHGIENFAIVLVLEKGIGEYKDPLIVPPVVVELSTGYRTPAQALDALLECLTTAPPDLTIVDEAMGKVAESLDRVRDIQDAIVTIAERLSTAEDAIRQLAGAPQVNPLLAGAVARRQAEAAPAAPRHTPPPSIRRPRGVPHLPTGGAFRPGQMGDPMLDDGDGEPEGDV